jgi:stress response protein YsnF
MKTIIAAFRDSEVAQQAIMFLRNRGVTNTEIMEGATSDLSRFDQWNIPEDRSRLYAEVLGRDACVVVAHVDHDANEIAQELDSLGSLDLDEELKRDTLSSAGGRNLDVIEEDVSIGKRDVDRGGVRVRTFVSEHPVEEQVELREERIDVQREPVNEPISPSAADAALTEEEFVVTAQGEEAVVGKEARVVERVHIGKEAEARTETVRDTERRRDVEVEPLEKPGARR